MPYIADFHIHSHYSRATARNLVPREIAFWARRKGITVVGTGDMTHSAWLVELRRDLEEAEQGLYRLKPDLEEEVQRSLPAACRGPVRFLLSGEISCIYKRGGRIRKVHNLVLLPDFDAAARLNGRLSRIGNLNSDGRPILGIDSRDLLEIVLEVDDRAFFIPAHIWTPWFSLFGSKSGFDAVEECFDDLTPHIHALETGLSSDPPMNRLLSTLDGYLLVSNSDAHSPSKLGREANLFDTPLGYDSMLEAMVTREGFLGTVEFFPEEGKYHYDGHRKCGISFHPRETRSWNGLCPECGKPVTLGVLHRIDELADRTSPRLTEPFYSLIPLPEILSEILGAGPATKKVLGAYEDLLAALGPELAILMDRSLSDIERAGGALLAEAVGRMRENRVIRQEGFDGQYGTIRLFREREIEEWRGQLALFAVPEVHSPKKERAPQPPKDHRPVTLEDPASERARSHSDPLLGPLNPAQREAVTHRGSHLLIVAGPGTGKTMTLTHRIAYLIREGVARPEQVLALTFTNKAAREMGERIESLLPEASSRGVFIATFHRFCLEVLRAEGGRTGLPEDFSLCPERDTLGLVREVVSSLGKGSRAARSLLKALPGLKRATLSDPPHDIPMELAVPFRRYQERLRKLGMLDLDDLEIETLRLFHRCPEVAETYARRFPWIFVDEYQDTNPTQVEILKTLIGTCAYLRERESETSERVPSLCAIGDPDQAIYGFRGADVRNFHAFEKDFGGARKVILPENYRSTQAILDAAAGLMGKGEALKGHRGRGEPLFVASCRTSEEEAEMIVEQIERLLGGTTYFSLDSGRVESFEEGENLGFGDIAILFRLNSQGDALEEALGRAGIPFVRSGERPVIERYPASLLWRFLRARLYPDIPYYRSAYLELAEEKGKEGERILQLPVPSGSLQEIIDQAQALHELKDLSEEEESVLRRFMEGAADFNGEPSAFLDLLSLERGIDHSILAGDRTALMSLHAAKGLEWPVVFITGCEKDLIPCSLFGTRDEDEEKRLFYVGMTRARNRLILSHSARRNLNGRILKGGPSPFLDLLPGACCRPLERRPWKPKKSHQKQLQLF
ncbi:MAG: UvrD-helicase domain-containing protein [Deltaproteobacteria bacterium]|nr:UvrD-helicase domain-containing protein [Deltaproteobacteria bacterium]